MTKSVKKTGGGASKMTGGGVARKKGVGVKKTNGGEGCWQTRKLQELEARYEIGAKKAAELLGTNYNTYKCWKNGTRKMTGSTIRLIHVMMLFEIKTIHRMFLT